MPRVPPPFSAAWIEGAAMRYLERFGSTRKNLRRILVRKVDASIREHGGDKSAAGQVIDDLLDRLEAARLIDDVAFAESRTRKLIGRGVSSGGVRARLAAKGVSQEDATGALQTAAADGDPDLRAAAAYARRRRMGPYNVGGDREKELARLGRAGFRYALAKQVLACATVDELEALLADDREAC
jgi:regulatory protein